jgi:hypothetical protein
VHRHVLDLEADVAARLQPGGDEVLDHLLLAVHGDGSAGHELVEGDAVPFAVVPELDAVMGQPFAKQALAHAGLDERVDRPLLQHAGSHPPLHVVAAALLQHH